MQITRRMAILGPAAPLAAAFAQKRPVERYPDAAPFVPTPPEIIDAMLKLADVRPDDVVYDLGCGDGRIVVMAAQKFRATAVGVEIDADLLREAREQARRAGVAERTRFIDGDLFQADIHGATVVMLYLIPKSLDRLKPKLLTELRPGTRVVSFTFPIAGWTPTKVENVNGRLLYFWIVPEKKPQP